MTVINKVPPSCYIFTFLSFPLFSSQVQIQNPKEAKDEAVCLFGAADELIAWKHNKYAREKFQQKR